MPSKKRLEDLEYNVFKKDMEGGGSASDEMFGTKDAGCLTVLAGIIVTVIVIVVIVGFMQIGHNAPAMHCAAPGCGNRLKPGSNYCWLHSSSSNVKRGSSSSGGSGSSSGGSSSSGSVIGGSSDSESRTRSKIWGGSGTNKNSTSGSSSASGSSGGSSSGGSSSGGSSIGK